MMSEFKSSASLPSVNTLPIDMGLVHKQTARRGNMQAAEFFYAEVAQRLYDRLSPIQIEVKRLLDAGMGYARRYDLLKQRFVDAQLIGVDNQAGAIAYAQQQHKKGWKFWTSSKQLPQFILADLAHTSLAPESIDLVWSNMALPWHNQPQAVLKEWRRVLRPEGLCLFTSFGTGNLPQIKQLPQALGICSMPLTDMHDLGDMLVEAGFSDPVMEQEVITLQYKHASTLLRELSALGGNAAMGQKSGLRSRYWYEQLLAALEAQRRPDGYIHLDLEVVYGHAWRANMVMRGPSEVGISLQGIGGRRKV